MGKQILIGWAQADITPERPVVVAGQMYLRTSSYVHDPLTATALSLSNGEEQYTMVSMDVVNVPGIVAKRFREALQGIPGLDPQKVSFHATHTHNSLRGIEDPYRENFEHYLGKDIITQIELPENLLHGEEEAQFLAEKVRFLVEEAWAARQPGGISYAVDYAAVAFNRRPVFRMEDGHEESKMYGTCSQENFLRMEGASDHTVDLFYTFDRENSLTGVAINVACPSQMYELHTFLSADYWGEVRNCVREEMGNIYVLPMGGAGGDQNPLDLVRLSKTNEEALRQWNAQAGEVFRNFDMAEECRGIGERVSGAVTRGYRKALRSIQFRPVFRHELVQFDMPIRTVTKEDYEEALEKIAQAKGRFSPQNRMTSEDMVAVFEPIGVARRWERQNADPRFCFQTHIVRIGDIAIATNPFELFTEYGMRIKARCKAAQAFVVQLCNDAGVYLPTQAAIAGGSYSSKPASTTVAPEQGDELVETTIAAIDRLFQKGVGA